MNTTVLDNIVSAILEALERGLPQETAVLEYMASTHGDTSVSAFEAVLTYRGDSDAASLAGLLLFPGETVLAGLEPALEAAGCSLEEAQAVADAVEKSAAFTHAVLPGGDRVGLNLEPGDARTFVARLRLERNPPRELKDILDNRLPLEMATHLKVMLRHCRLEWSPQRIFFLSALLGNTPSSPDEIPEILSWALSWLGVLQPDAPAQELFGEKYGELAGRLKRSLDFHAALTKSSFEVMMAQGARVVLPHPDSIRRELALLDAVCLAVAGVPAWSLAGMAEADLGFFEDGEEMIAALRGLGD